MTFIQMVVDFVFSTLIGGVVSFFRSRWTRKKVLTTLFVVGGLAWLFTQSDDAPLEVMVERTPEVQVELVGNLGGAGSFVSTGVVEALAEAQLKAEAGGRVTAVNTEIGRYVTAGSVIATLDNASQRAALLQAQGAYEAAVAASRQGVVGVGEATAAVATAERNAVTAVAAAYNTVTGVIKSDIDTYFSNPTTALPGLRINGFGNTGQITAARNALRLTMAKWQGESATLAPSPAVDQAVENSRLYTGEAIAIIDSLITALERDTSGGSAEAAERTTKVAGLTAARGALLGVQTSLQATLSSLSATRDALARADINAGTSGPSTSNAQITQALGALRAAQAQYERTLVRTPISGVVNALYIKRGDFVAPQADAAVIANNNGKQVTGAITDADRGTIEVGDVVTFDGAATGTVTAIAGAVDPKTGKVAIKMSVSNPDALTTGSTVAISFAGQATTTTAAVSAPISIPLTAVKLMADGAVVYTVTDESKIAAQPITLGRVLGESIIVTEGLDVATAIVVDVRGLKEGEVVVIKD